MTQIYDIFCRCHDERTARAIKNEFDRLQLGCPTIEKQLYVKAYAYDDNWPIEEVRKDFEAISGKYPSAYIAVDFYYADGEQGTLFFIGGKGQYEGANPERRAV